MPGFVHVFLIPFAAASLSNSDSMRFASIQFHHLIRYHLIRYHLIRSNDRIWR